MLALNHLLFLYGGYYIYLLTVNNIPKLHEIAICVFRAMSTTWPTIQHDTIRVHHDLACVGRGFPRLWDYLQIEVSFTTAWNEAYVAEEEDDDK